MPDYSPHLDPLSVFLVKTGARGGDRVLFRYPYTMAVKRKEIPPHCNEYSVMRVTEGAAAANVPELRGERLSRANLVAFDNKTLAHLFAVSPALCDEKFELKVDLVRFVGHPRSIEPLPNEVVADEGKSAASSQPAATAAAASPSEVPSSSTSPSTSALDEDDPEDKKDESALTMFVVVFALSARASYSVVKQYHELARDVAQAIRNEELRDGFLRREADIMVKAQDEVAAMPPEEKPTSPFSLVETRSELARDLTKAFKDIKSTGMLETRFNGWSEVTFSLPQKVHKQINPALLVEPDPLEDYFENIRPYHALLLLQSLDDVTEEMPLDYCPGTRSIVENALPTKCFTKLASDAALDLQFVWDESCNLVYWGKATIIFPLAGSNIYVLNPYVANHNTTSLRDRFAEIFPSESYTHYLELLSLPTPVAQLLPATAKEEETNILHGVLIWMLQNHLLIQLHKYIGLAITDDGTLLSYFPDPRSEEAEEGLFPNAPTAPPSAGAGAAATAASDQEAQEDGFPATTLCKEEETAEGIVGRKVRWMTREQLLEVFAEPERQEIASVPASSNLEDLRLFVRLVPYFCHEYHLESIMFWENVTRNQVLILVDKFMNVLSVEEREDHHVTDYFKLNIINI